MCLIAAAASWLRGGHYVHAEDGESGEGGDGGVGPFGVPTAESADPDASPHPEEWIPA
jgi:hypothetical protein